MDLEQVLELSPGCTVRGGDCGDVRDADVVVLLSATPLTVGTSRLEYLAKNARHRRRAGRPARPRLAGRGRRRHEPRRPARHAAAAADRPRPAADPRLHDQRQPAAAHGPREGARRPAGQRRGLGDRRARRPERAAVRPGHRERRARSPDAPSRRPRAEEYLRTWYVRHVALDSGRSSTWTSGLGVARMVAALDGDGELWPASVVLDGEYGIDGVAVSVPVTLGRGGAEQIHEWELSPADLDALRASAEFVRSATGEHRMSTAGDRQEIRELIENWVVWRDAGDWERFRTVWHDDGRMMATWFQGPADEFIRVSREGFERGVRILHFLGGTSIDVAGTRAIAQTKMTITQRAPVHDVVCDVVCTGRFYDFLERRDGVWRIVLRQPIYEQDRLNPVDPAATARARPGAARALPGRLPPPRLPPDAGRVHRQAGHAGPDRPGGRGALRPRRGLARAHWLRRRGSSGGARAARGLDLPLARPARRPPRSAWPSRAARGRCGCGTPRSTPAARPPRS